jgi:hypothetical protein
MQEEIEGCRERISALEQLLRNEEAVCDVQLRIIETQKALVASLEADDGCRGEG